MPRGRSTFNKRQKEQARQQKQRDKNERKTQRKQDLPEGTAVLDEAEELRLMREHAAEQAALFGIGGDDDPDPIATIPSHSPKAVNH
jgi:hypothetical protein